MFGKLRQDENYKSNNLQDNIWQTIAGQLGYLGSCCFIFSDKVLAFVKLHRSINILKYDRKLTVIF